MPDRPSAGVPNLKPLFRYSPLRWRTRAGRGGLLILFVFGLLGAYGVWPRARRAGEKITRMHETWRVQRWLKAASEAEGIGQFHAAAIALETALIIAPENTLVQIRQADLLVRMGQRQEGMAAWRRLYSGAGRPAGGPLALVFATRLIAAGEFRELAALALHQLHHDERNKGLWLNLAAEAYPLAGQSPTEAQLVGVPRDGYGPVLAGYVFARLRQAGPARVALARLENAALPPPVALLAARAQLELGESGQARAMLTRNNQVLRPEEVTTLELLYADRQAGLAAFAVDRLFPARTLPADAERRLALFVLHGLKQPAPAAAVALGDRLRDQESRLSRQALAALWIYAGRARDEDEERFWRERLAARIGTTLPRLDDAVFSAALLRIIVDRAPLPLELICGLMAVTEVTAGPARPARPPAPTPGS